MSRSRGAIGYFRWCCRRSKKAKIPFGAVAAIIIASVFSTNDVLNLDTSEKSNKVQASVQNNDNPLEKNKYQPLNYLVVKYYKDLQSGRMKHIKTPKYTEWYQGIDVYTKKGEEFGTYVVFVSYNMKVQGSTVLFPGLDTMYAVRNEEGDFHFVDKPYSKEVEAYIQELAKEKEVQELFSEVENRYAYARNKDFR